MTIMLHNSGHTMGMFCKVLFKKYVWEEGGGDSISVSYVNGRVGTCILVGSMCMLRTKEGMVLSCVWSCNLPGVN